MNQKLMNVADLVNPNSGLTYRQENSAKTHAIPLGALVEVNNSGLRLYVVNQGRDCDQTPLYWLSMKTVEEYRDLEEKNRNLSQPTSNLEVFFNGHKKGFEAGCCDGGYSEESLTVIRLPK